jgi:hypothetical protein
MKLSGWASASGQQKKTFVQTRIVVALIIVPKIEILCGMEIIVVSCKDLCRTSSTLLLQVIQILYLILIVWGGRSPSRIAACPARALVSRADLTQPLHSAVVGEGACSLLLPHHLQAVSLSRSDPVLGFVRSRQRFASLGL